MKQVLLVHLAIFSSQDGRPFVFRRAASAGWVRLEALAKGEAGGVEVVQSTVLRVPSFGANTLLFLWICT